jgi:hypothetical protein
MTDKSQKDDMRAALQGDLERARERRGSTLLDREPEPEAVSDTAAEAPEPALPVSDTWEPDPEPEPEGVSDTAAEPPDPTPPVSDTSEPEPEQKRIFLWFLRR